MCVCLCPRWGKSQYYNGSPELMSSGLEIFSKNVGNVENLGLYVMYRDEREFYERRNFREYSRGICSEETYLIEEVIFLNHY